MTPGKISADRSAHAKFLKSTNLLTPPVAAALRTLRQLRTKAYAMRPWAATILASTG